MVRRICGLVALIIKRKAMIDNLTSVEYASGGIRTLVAPRLKRNVVTLMYVVNITPKVTKKSDCRKE